MIRSHNCGELQLADVNKKVVKEYKIQAVPVFIVFRNSKEIFRHVGLISKEELLKHLTN